MTLSETLKKIEGKRHLIGYQTKPGDFGEIEHLIPAPTDERVLSGYMIYAKDRILDGENLKINSDDDTEFDIMIFFKGSIYDEDGWMSGSIFWQWLKDYPEIY